MCWSDWRIFPNFKIAGYEFLYAPFYSGVYQLRHFSTKKNILFGCGENVAHRMTTLLSPPYGIAGRNNVDKTDYVLKHIDDIEYRTYPCDKETAKKIEKGLKADKNHIFNT